MSKEDMSGLDDTFEYWKILQRQKYYQRQVNYI